jgi:hypothetical protein
VDSTGLIIDFSLALLIMRAQCYEDERGADTVETLRWERSAFYSKAL